MTTQIILNENDIQKLIAKSFSVDVTNVHLSISEELKGYGLGEHMERCIKASVIVPSNDFIKMEHGGISKMCECVYGGNNMTKKQVVDFLRFAIYATDIQDDYSSGLRNGMRLAINCLTDENPKFEKLDRTVGN